MIKVDPYNIALHSVLKCHADMVKTFLAIVYRPFHSFHVIDLLNALQLICCKLGVCLYIFS